MVQEPWVLEAANLHSAQARCPRTDSAVQLTRMLYACWCLENFCSDYGRGFLVSHAGNFLDLPSISYTKLVQRLGSAKASWFCYARREPVAYATRERGLSICSPERLKLGFLDASIMVLRRRQPGLSLPGFF